MCCRDPSLSDPMIIIKLIKNHLVGLHLLTIITVNIFLQISKDSTKDITFQTFLRTEKSDQSGAKWHSPLFVQTWTFLVVKRGWSMGGAIDGGWTVYPPFFLLNLVVKRGGAIDRGWTNLKTGSTMSPLTRRQWSKKINSIQAAWENKSCQP